MADLVSELHGIPTLEERDPILRGTLTGLQRGSLIQGEPFDNLVASLISLFHTTTSELSQEHLSKARTELVLNLPQLSGTLAPGQLNWTPEMLPLMLREVPAQTPLSVYGRAAHWVYTALALHTSPAPFYQFDARLGWLEPLPMQYGSGINPEIVFEAEEHEQFAILHSTLRTHNLDYIQSSHLSVPPLSLKKGLVISGKLPLWLASSLALFYQQAGIPWIAGYYPQKQGAVVVFSHLSMYALGDLIPNARNSHNY